MVEKCSNSRMLTNSFSIQNWSVKTKKLFYKKKQYSMSKKLNFISNVVKDRKFGTHCHIWWPETSQIWKNKRKRSHNKTMTKGDETDEARWCLMMITTIRAIMIMANDYDLFMLQCKNREEEKERDDVAQTSSNGLELLKLKTGSIKSYRQIRKKWKESKGNNANWPNWSITIIFTQ